MLSWLTGDEDRALPALGEGEREGSDKDDQDDKDVLMSELGPIMAACKNLSETAKDITRTTLYIERLAAEIAIPTRLRLLGVCIVTTISLARGCCREVLALDNPQLGRKECTVPSRHSSKVRHIAWRSTDIAKLPTLVTPKWRGEGGYFDPAILFDR